MKDSDTKMEKYYIYLYKKTPLKLIRGVKNYLNIKNKTIQAIPIATLQIIP